VRSFAAKIYKLGINPVVDPPKSVLADLFETAGSQKSPIPVRGKINGADYSQTLVKFQSAWRLYINGAMLRASGLSVGDEAVVEIEFDPSPREVPIPPALAAAFENDEQAKIGFGNLPPSRQKEIFRYIGSLKTEASIARNVEKILRELKTEVIKPLARFRMRKSN
jgi:hypothetical protein